MAKLILEHTDPEYTSYDHEVLNSTVGLSDQCIQVLDITELKSKPLRRLSKELLYKAIIKTGGVISEICKVTGFSYSAVKRHIELDNDLVQAIKDQQEELLDLCEISLNSQIANGEEWAVKFLLSTKGASRGYVKPSTNNTNIQINQSQNNQTMNLGGLSNEELAQLETLLEKTNQ